MGSSFDRFTGGAMLSGIHGGSIAVIIGSLCGFSIAYLIQGVWFLELVSYFVFVNANFGKQLSE